MNANQFTYTHTDSTSMGAKLLCAATFGGGQFCKYKKTE